MLGNFWFKKEKPLLGLTGMGGGVGSSLVSSGGAGLKATGGTTSNPGDGYTYHQFYASVPGTVTVTPFDGGPYTKTPNTSETFVALEALTCDVLIIGGGAGGGHTPTGNTGGGGGGAGCVIYLTGQSLPATTYPLTVGGGGQSNTAPPASANNGDASIFNGSTAYGGGSGGKGAGVGGAGANGTGPTNQGSGGGGGAGQSGGGGAGGSTGNPAHPGSGTDVPSVPASVYGFGRAGGSGGGDGSNLSAGGGGGGISSVGLAGQSGTNAPGYSQGGAGGAGGDYTIIGTAQGIGGGGAGGSYSKTGINPPAYDSGGGIQDGRAWPTAMAIYPYPVPIGIPARFHGLDGTGGGGTGGTTPPGIVSGAPTAIMQSGRGGCGLVQIRYPV